MSAPRISIARLMAFIALFGVTLSALRAVTEFWSGAMLTLALAASGVALLGRLSTHGSDRVAWTGYLIFGTGYLVMCVGPWGNEHVMPNLVTTPLIDEQLPKMEYTPRYVGERVWTPDGPGRYAGHYVTGPVDEKTASIDVTLDRGTFSYNLTQLRPISPESYRRLCHSALSLWLGLFGMPFARYLFGGRQDRSIREREVEPAPPA